MQRRSVGCPANIRIDRQVGVDAGSRSARLPAARERHCPVAPSNSYPRPSCRAPTETAAGLARWGPGATDRRKSRWPGLALEDSGAHRTTPPHPGSGLGKLPPPVPEPAADRDKEQFARRADRVVPARASEVVQNRPEAGNRPRDSLVAAPSQAQRLSTALQQAKQPSGSTSYVLSVSWSSPHKA